MTDRFTIRETTPADVERILAFYPQVFADEELRPVVSALLALEQGVVSHATFEDEVVVGHIIFTRCNTQPDFDVQKSGPTGALLGPLGVAPTHQRQGLGSALVHAGLQRLATMGVRQIFVLGDPAYYTRFGFQPERNILPPYPIPDQWADAWQSMPLATHETLGAGRLMLPKPWMAPELWAP